eukprot:403356401
MSNFLCGCFSKKKQRKGIYDNVETGTKQQSSHTQSLPPIKRDIFKDVEQMRFREEDFDKLNVGKQQVIGNINLQNQKIPKNKKASNSQINSFRGGSIDKSVIEDSESNLNQSHSVYKPSSSNYSQSQMTNAQNSNYNNYNHTAGSNASQHSKSGGTGGMQQRILKVTKNTIINPSSTATNGMVILTPLIRRIDSRGDEREQFMGQTLQQLSFNNSNGSELRNLIQMDVSKKKKEKKSYRGEKDQEYQDNFITRGSDLEKQRNNYNSSSASDKQLVKEIDQSSIDDIRKFQSKSERPKTYSRHKNREQDQRMSQIQESDQENDETQTEEQISKSKATAHQRSRQHNVIGSRRGRAIQSNSSLSQNTYLRRESQKENLRASGLVPNSNSQVGIKNKYSASNIDIRSQMQNQSIINEGTYESKRNDNRNNSDIEEENDLQTFVVTEEERDELPEIIKVASFEERRIREKQFFENIKKTQQGHENENLYIVNIKWVKEWTSFLAGHGKCPSKISNKQLYKKYFIQGQQLDVSIDYYFMTERMWKFLYSIYGGGPIMKKRICPSLKQQNTQSISSCTQQYQSHQTHQSDNKRSKSTFQKSNQKEKHVKNLSAQPQRKAQSRTQNIGNFNHDGNFEDFNILIEDYNLDKEEKKYNQTASKTPKQMLKDRPDSSYKSGSDRFIPGTFDIDNIDFKPNDSFDTSKISEFDITRINKFSGNAKSIQGDDEVNTTRPSSSLSGLIHNQSMYNKSKNTNKNMSDNQSNHSNMKKVQYPQGEFRVVGLDNPSYFCYMNTILQTLLSIKEFRYYFYRKEFNSIQYPTHFQKKTYCTSVSKLIKEMLELEEEYVYIKPSFFHNLIERKFTSNLQHDAHEFLIFLLSQLQDELNPGPQSEANRRFSMTSSQASTFWKSYKSAHPSIIDNLFVGQLSQIVQCKQCEYKSPSSIPFKDISLSITQNLKQSLQHFLATEKLEGTPDEMYSCIRCQTKTNAKIKKRFLNLPKYLIINLKRFQEVQNHQFIKNKKPIEYPLSMDMDDYCNQPWDKLGKFMLQSVVLHKGQTIESGHYNCITRRLDGQWWFCNDSEIQRVTKVEHVLQSKKSASILIYEKIDADIQSQ